MLLLIPIVGCSSSSSNAVDGGSCGIQATSTNEEAHTHTLCVLTSDLTSPPAGGVTYTTSDVGSHTHSVRLSTADLTALNSGQTVTVTSTLDPDPLTHAVHSHAFTLKKM